MNAFKAVTFSISQRRHNGHFVIADLGTTYGTLPGYCKCITRPSDKYTPSSQSTMSSLSASVLGVPCTRFCISSGSSRPLTYPQMTPKCPEFPRLTAGGGVVTPNSISMGINTTT